MIRPGSRSKVLTAAGAAVLKIQRGMCNGERRAGELCRIDAEYVLAEATRSCIADADGVTPHQFDRGREIKRGAAERELFQS